MTLRRLLFLTVVVLLPAASSHAQAPLRSAVFPADSARVRKGGNANQRSIVDTLTPTLAKLEMHETTLEPGQMPHPSHRHAHDELMIVKTGTIEVYQDKFTRIAKPGAVIFMSSGEMHGLKNIGQTKASYL